MHNKVAWPSVVWRTSGTVSSRRIIDVTVMETSAAGLSSLLMYAILRRKQKQICQYENQVVRVRIRIRGSVPLTNESRWPKNMQIRISNTSRNTFPNHSVPNPPRSSQGLPSLFQQLLPGLTLGHCCAKPAATLSGFEPQPLQSRLEPEKQLCFK
jgi:hypothetical protein